MIRGNEKVKLQAIVARIERGIFDANDVDGLLMKLRGFSQSSAVFREVADFVAHNDERDRGIINRSMQNFLYRVRFLYDYQSEGSHSLNISKPFPAYVVRLIHHQIGICDESHLRMSFSCTKKVLTNRVEKLFSIDKKTALASVANPISNETFNAISYVLSFVKVEPIASQDELIEEILSVLRANNVKR